MSRNLTNLYALFLSNKKKPLTSLNTLKTHGTCSNVHDLSCSKKISSDLNPIAGCGAFPFSADNSYSRNGGSRENTEFDLSSPISANVSSQNSNDVGNDAQKLLGDLSTLCTQTTHKNDYCVVTTSEESRRNGDNSNGGKNGESDSKDDDSVVPLVLAAAASIGLIAGTTVHDQIKELERAEKFLWRDREQEVRNVFICLWFLSG